MARFAGGKHATISFLSPRRAGIDYDCRTTMPLSSGTRVGPYEVQSPLGSGGKDADMLPLTAANNSFAADIYAAVRAGSENLFLSPFSIATALSMVHAGARGKTAEQMAAVLHLPRAQEQASGFAALLKQLQSGADAGGYRLSIANGLWLEKVFPFLPAFVATLTSEYGAAVEPTDFVNESEAARREINAWVERQTQEKIKDLFPARSIQPLTRLVLANAIYFKGKWATQFRSQFTAGAPFTTSAGSKLTVRMMQHHGGFPYYQEPGFQLLEMPYKSARLAMDVFLPRTATGLEEFERSITAAKLAEWLSHLHRETVDIFFPRFNVTSSFELNRVLASMGMPEAFAPGADFSGMSPRGRELNISAVLHKAYVDVNEEGTEAAAATGVSVITMAAAARPVEFRADHPFFFVIREVSSGAILFMGRVEEP